MGWRFHRVLNIIPGLVRLNVSKSGVSTSLGPRGADVNIGPHGATTNAGIPGTGLSYRQKLGVAHGSGIGVGLFIAALVFAGWRYFDGELPSTHLPNPAPSSQSASATDTMSDDADDSGGIPTVTHEHRSGGVRHARGDDANAGADVIAAAKPASGTMFVHRNNSDLRGKPATSSPAIKKLIKGEQVRLIAVSDKWSEVQDGATKGWVRSSIIKDTPPGAKRPRKKKPGSND